MLLYDVLVVYVFLSLYCCLSVWNKITTTTIVAIISTNIRLTIASSNKYWIGCTETFSYTLHVHGEPRTRTCRDECRDRYLAVSFEVGGGENVPGIPSACATRDFTYLARGSLPDVGHVSRAWHDQTQTFRAIDEGPFYQQWLTLFPACRNNYMHRKLWCEINYPFPNSHALKSYPFIIFASYDLTN